jgi:hypothetical protein
MALVSLPASTAPPAAAPVDLPPVALIGPIEAFLRTAITDLHARSGPWEPTGTRGRPRILPALCLWAGVLVCVVRGFSSELAVWRLLSVQGLWHYPRFPVSDQAIYNRLAQAGDAGTDPAGGAGGPAVLQALFAQISTVLGARLAPLLVTATADLAPFATDVVALDQSTLDQVARLLPPLRPLSPGDARLLPGKLATAFDVRRQQFRTVQYCPDPHANEKRSARALVADLAPGTLVLADLGYFAFAWFDELTEHGLWWLSRLRQKTSYRLAHVLYQHGDTLDALVWLGAHRADRAQHLVRLVQFRRGPALYRYLTNVTDPQVLSPYAVARLYARRWDIELAFLLIKRHLGLHLLWSAKTEVILVQVWAVLIVAQVLQALRLEIAGRAGVDPYEVSLPLLVQYLPHFAAQGVDPVRAFVEQGRCARFIRPSTRTRIEAPVIPLDAYTLPPPDLVREQVPRYAHRTTPRRRDRPVSHPAI